jgi:DNA-binding NarL/FixJ family response regulator
MLEPPTERPLLDVIGGCGDDRAGHGSVLVVDDDAAFRGLARRVLAVFDLGVVGEAASVAAALVAATRLRPTAVLVDVGLPDGDGITLACELVALPWHPRVVLTSSDAGAATAHDVSRSGARAFVPKDRLPNSPLDRLLG